METGDFLKPAKDSDLIQDLTPVDPKRVRDTDVEVRRLGVDLSRGGNLTKLQEELFVEPQE